MHTGPVVIADGGEVFGETPNIAARVQAAAEPDTVVVTAATQRLAAGIFVVEDRGPQELKGVREPVVLYRVVRPSGVRSRLDVAAGRLTRFVGREMELGDAARALGARGTTARDRTSLSWARRASASRASSTSSASACTMPHTWLECGATPYTEGYAFPSGDRARGAGPDVRGGDTATEKLVKIERGVGRPRLAGDRRPPRGLPRPAAADAARINPMCAPEDARAPGAVEPGAQRGPAARPPGRGPALVRRVVARAPRPARRAERDGARSSS